MNEKKKKNGLGLYSTCLGTVTEIQNHNSGRQFRQNKKKTRKQLKGRSTGHR